MTLRKTLNCIEITLNIYQFCDEVGTALLVLIRSLCPKAYVIATSYLFPVLQNCVDLSLKHNIDLVSTEYPRPQNSIWLEKVKKNT